MSRNLTKQKKEKIYHRISQFFFKMISRKAVRMGKRFFYSAVIFSLICVTSKVSAQWEKILDAGRTTLAFDNVILVGSDSGCYRSLDYGENWTFHIADTLHITMPYPQEVLLGIGRLCRNDKYIFAATGASIYSSADTGTTWKPIGPFPEGRPLGMNNVFAKIRLYSQQ
jgi:hypothetical protein